MDSEEQRALRDLKLSIERFHNDFLVTCKVRSFFAAMQLLLFALILWRIW